MNKISDENQRQQALDVTKSFIVQAPAGSGKTELLTQRFLALLSKAVTLPEEIIAITFTRKAAAEMRERIIQSLNFAKHNPAPSSAHAYKTWQLATAVLEKDATKNWNLLQNPNRLRIFTIDSLCARIAKAAPLLSHFGAVPKVVEDASQYYVLAAQSLLGSLEENQFYSNALELLLLHLDNNYLLIEKLFIGMLQRRDQWLPYLAGQQNIQSMRKKLELGLHNIILHTIHKCRTLIEKEDTHELLALARYAANNLKHQQSPIINCDSLMDLPDLSVNALPQWLGIAELLLTKSFEWRRAINKNSGFPSNSQAKNKAEQQLFKNMKERMELLLSSLEKNEALRRALEELLLLPPANYSDKQWCIIESLMILLPLLVAHLHLVFQENNVVDFTEIAQGAISALGDFQAPTDLILNLDYKIQHILVDEFQDTSATQFYLLELLIHGWSHHDGKTIFLVGDPMQSIYRFREADVGIFLHVKKNGIGPVQLQSLTLHVNFRSENGIIDWVNETFTPMFPKTEDINCGAVCYNPSQAIHGNSRSPSVFFHHLEARKEHEEANCIVDIIKKEIAENPQTSLAILVRSRSHLQSIIPSLKSASIPFQAIEIEKLKNCSVVQDLYALTKAICHLGDRVAWFAILRAPWCGLTLADLYTLAKLSYTTLWEVLLQLDETSSVSHDGLLRIKRILPILATCLQQRRRDTLRNCIQNVWYQLGGPACIDYDHELENAERFFQLLDEVNLAGDIINFELLEIKLDNLYTHAHPSSQTNVHIMTIHKAKGLEFDVVILPGLNKKPANEDNRLLLWCERKKDDNESDLILAPIKSLEEDFDPIYRYVRVQDSIKSRYETVRLLYVATTRAKKSLHLLSSISMHKDTQELKLPESGSFLEFLWPQIQALLNNAIEHPKEPDNIEENKIRCIKRLTLEWTFETPLRENNFNTNSFFKYQWQAEYQHHIGTVVHQILQSISLNSLDLWKNGKILTEKRLWQKKLLQLGVNPIFLDECVNTIDLAISKTLEDPRGCWILNSKHQEAQSELSITSVIQNKICHFVIDRTFIDDNGTRWIIDYKTTQLLTKNLPHFLTYAKKQHQEQLESYANALYQLGVENPIRMGLYFPLFSGWIEWPYD